MTKDASIPFSVCQDCGATYPSARHLPKHECERKYLGIEPQGVRRLGIGPCFDCGTARYVIFVPYAVAYCPKCMRASDCLDESEPDTASSPGAAS